MTTACSAVDAGVMISAPDPTGTNNSHPRSPKQLARIAAAVSLALAPCTALAQTAAYAQSAPELTLTRFDCGTPRDTNVNERFSDTFAYPGMKRTFVFSCYLIKHGNEYMMWDTGYGPSAE